MVVVTANSCRTDQLPEQETYYNNKAKFHLTSKRISLDESKHKKFLFSELEKSKTNLQKLKLDIAGKVINYGNGVSIDTDDVIYIENGPNYHTYTFHITRENALPNDPIENLVLTPLKDGTYRELFVSYNFTPQDKEILKNGGFVDTKGKTIITELGIGTYSPLSKGGMTTCGWVESETFVTVCSANEHGLWNTELWDKCKADVKPGWHTTMVYKCEFLEDINNPTPGSPSTPYENPGGPSDGGVPGTGTGDCDSPGVLKEPQDPSSGMGEGGCDIGVPSIPNLPNPKKTPCEKTKTLLADPEIQTKIDALEEKSKTKGEQAFLYMNDNTPSSIIDGGDHEVNLSPYSGYKGIYHNHTKLGTKMLAVKDIIQMYKTVAFKLNSATAKEAFVGMVAHETCNCPPDNFVYHNYLLRFNGDFSQTGAIATLTKEEIEKLRDDFDKIEIDLLSIPSLRNGSNLTAELNAQGLEQLFFGTLAKMKIDPDQIILQKIEKDGTINNINLNSDGTTTPVPCP